MNQIYKWRKKPNTGRHHFAHAGVRHTIEPGMTVEATKMALGGAVKKYECLGLAGIPMIDVTVMGEKSTFIKGPIQAPAKELIIVPHGTSKLRFDIINPDNPGKPLNTKSLRRQDAEKVLGKMLEDLNGLNVVIPDLANMDWDALAIFMDSAGIEIKDEYETEDDLRQAITEAMK